MGARLREAGLSYGTDKHLLTVLRTLQTWSYPSRAKTNSISGPIVVPIKKMIEGNGKGKRPMVNPRSASGKLMTSKEVSRLQMMLTLVGVITPGDMAEAFALTPRDTRIREVPLVFELNPNCEMGSDPQSETAADPVVVAAWGRALAAVVDAAATIRADGDAAAAAAERNRRADKAVAAVRELPTRWFLTNARREALIRWSFLGHRLGEPGPFPALDTQFYAAASSPDCAAYKRHFQPTTQPDLLSDQPDLRTELPDHLQPLPLIEAGDTPAATPILNVPTVSARSADGDDAACDPSGEDPTTQETPMTTFASPGQDCALPGMEDIEPEASQQAEPPAPKRSKHLDDVTAPIFAAVLHWRVTQLPPFSTAAGKSYARGRWCSAVSQWMSGQRRNQTAWSVLAETNPEQAAAQLIEALSAGYQNVRADGTPWGDVHTAEAVAVVMNRSLTPNRSEASARKAGMDAAAAHREVRVEDPCGLADAGKSTAEVNAFYAAADALTVGLRTKVKTVKVEAMAAQYLSTGVLPNHDPRWMSA